jgi:hypothetical protein
MNPQIFSRGRCAGWIAVWLTMLAAPAVLGQPNSTNTITGTIALPGERDVFTFSLTSPARYYFDALTNAGTLNWSLEGPTGLLVNNRGFTASDAGSASVLSLDPGFYRLTVDADTTNTPAYAFRFVNLAAAALLTPDTVVSNTLAPGNETDLYQFTANAGDQFVFDRLFQTVSQNVWWRLIDPYGNEIFTSFFNDVSTVTLQVTGAYTLLVEGYLNNDAVTTYSFIADRGINSPLPPLTGTPITLGQVVSGGLTNVSTNAFTFTLAADTRLTFDNLTNSSSTQWLLQGPPGPAFLFVNNQAVNNSDGLNGVTVLDLHAGNYQLRVRHTTADIAPYRFRLLDVATGAALTPGTQTTATLNPANETDLFRFTAAAGTKLFFDSISSTGVPNVYWRCVDPLGGILFANSFSDQGPVTLTVGGEYALLIEGYFNDTGSGSCTFNVVPVTDGVQALTVGALTTSAISQPGQSQQYLFTLSSAATLYFDSRTNNSQLRWSLAGPAGALVNNRGFNVSDAAQLADVLLQLPAGDYTLTVTGTGDETGGFGFRLLDLAGAPPLTPGMPLSGTLSPANETDAYRFTAAPGTKVYFDAVNSTGLPNAVWRCFGPYGTPVFPSHPNYFNDVGPVVLTDGGTYTLLVEGSHGDSGSGAYTIQVLPVNDGAHPLVIGDLVNGTIASPGQSQVYTFALPGAATLYFDALTNNADLRWSLSGPTGVLVNNRAFTQTDANNAYAVLSLTAGEYTLTIDASADNTGGYHFRLFDLAGAPPLTPGVPVSNTLDPANETHAYRFTLGAGADVYFDSIDSTGLGNAYWRCIDPYGRVVLANSFFDDGPVTLAAAGIYTLLVEGHYGNTGSGTYQFNVVPVNDGAQILTLGSLVTGAITVPGQAQSYTFTLPVAASLYFDSRTDDFNLRWTLDGPNGRPVNNRLFPQSDAHNGYAVLDLAPGDYTLTVTGSADSTGGFEFRLFNLATASLLTPGTVTGGTLDPANETDAYRFTVATGTKVFFDSISSSGLANVYWRCIDSSGDIVLANGFNDLGPVTLAAGGVYTLLVEGHYQNTGSGSYQFNVVPVNDGTQALTLGSLVTGAVTLPGQTRSYTFTLPASATLYFDSLTNITNLRWSLDGPSGRIVNNRAFTQSDALTIGDPLLPLPPGSYTLTVSAGANDDSTGGFRFRLFDITTASVLTLGSVRSDTLNPGNETDAYRFSANAGDRYSFNWISQTAIPNSYWRLFDPFGNQIFGRVTDNAGTNRLLAAGTYTLLVEGYYDDVAIGSYQFSVVFVDNVPVSFTGTPLAIGSTISSNLANATTTNAHTFTLASPARLIFDSLVNSSIGWSLTGPMGNEVVNRAFNNSDSYESDALLNLPAGPYRLTVNGAAGAYSFRLLDAATATAFTPGTLVTNTITPGRATVLYRFDATAGDRFFYDGRPRSGFTHAPYVRLYSPFNERLLNQQEITTDADVFVVPHTGSCLLTVEGRYADTSANGNFSFLLHRVIDGTNTFAVGQTVTGAISVPGQRQFHGFNLAVPMRLLFDTLTNSFFTWTLTGPPGVVVNNRSFNSSDGYEADAMLNLPAGDYLIEVDTTGDDTGRYSFRLLDAALATAFTPGTLVTNSLAPGPSTRLYTFNATAGDRFYFDGRPRSGFSHTPYVRLYSPFDHIVLQQQDATTDADVFSVPHTGSYLLAVEGRYADTSTNGNFSFLLQPVTDGLSAITVGATVNGAITTAGQRQFHTFTLASPARLFFDTLRNVDFTWTLTGPPGVIVQDRQFLSSDSYDGDALLNLPAGDHVIEVDASGTDTGNYAFRLVDSTAAATFTPGALVNGALAPGNSTTLYRFTAAAGDRFFFDGRPRTGFTAEPYLRLYSPLGFVVFSQQGVTADLDVFVVPHSGSYLLSVEGRYIDTSTNGNFSFLFHPVVDGSNTFTIGQTVNGALAVPGQRQFHSFTLPAPARLFFDTLNASSFQCVMTGPGGVILNRQLWVSDSIDGVSLLDLPAGDYTIMIDESGATTGSYTFRLLDASSATLFTPGVPVSGSLAPGVSTALWRFNANAGDPFYYDGRPGSGFTSFPYVRLYTPLGDSLLSPVRVDLDADTFSVPQTGSYILAVEGRYTETAPSGAYSFNLVPNPPQPPTPLFDTNVAPDLVVTGVAVTPPSGLQSGQSATVSWTTRNNGTAATPGSFTERVTVRNTGTAQVIVNRTLFYDEAASGAINPSATRNRQLSITLPDGPGGAGNLEVTVTTDTLNNIFEQNGGGTAEANNAASISITTTLAPYPDLQVASLSVAPPSAWGTGSVVTVSWVTTNTGTRATSGSWTENLLVRNTNTSQVIVNAVTDYDPTEPGNGDIPPGGSRVRSLDFTMPMNDSAYGAFEVTITTDSGNAVFEHNAGGTAESNNSRSLISASAPDLAVNGLSVTADPSAQAGAELTIQWNTANQGNVPAAGVFYDRVTVRNTNTAEVLLNTALPYNPAVAGNGPIDPGNSIAREHTFNLPDGARSVGRLEITVTADTFNQLVEHNGGGTAEANNAAQTSIAIAAAPYPDLVVTNIVAPASGLPGQQVAVIWTTRNVGTVPADGPWSDHLFLSTDNVIGGDQFLTSVFFSGSLASGASITRTQQVTLPAFGTGNRYFVVEADASGVLFEERETNNAAIAALPTAISAALTLTLSPTTVQENAGSQAVQATVTRNSSAAASLVVNLSSSQPAKVVVPASVTIPVGASAASFFVVVVDDAQVGGDVMATITAQAAAHVNGTDTLTVRENDSPRLTLALSAASVLESAAPGAVTGRVTRNVNTNVALLVTLGSSRPAALTVPASVNIPVGQTSAVFNLSPVNDDLVTGARSANVFASAAGFSDVSAPIDVLDDDSVTLTLRLSDTNVAENVVNPAAIATITRTPVSSGLLRVRLGTNGGGGLQIPAEVTIPASQSAVSFNVNVRDDNLAYGAQTVSIRADGLAVDGSPIAGASATASMHIRENDGPTLGVSIAAAVVEEGAGTIAVITRNTPPTNSLTVTLSAAPAGQAALPASVVLAPGATSTNVTLTGVVDGKSDGAVEVTVTAATAGYNPGSALVTVTDIDVPDLAVLEVSGPTNALTDGLITAIWAVTNSGLSTASAPWVDELYLATDAQGANAFIVARVTNSLPVVVGDSYEVARSFLLPSEPGTYWLLLRTDAGGAVTEGSERNNALLSAAIDVQPSYRATVSTTVDSALSGTPIPLTGRTFFSVGGAPAPFRTATVRVNVGRVRRFLDVISDAQGNFFATFQPIPGEAGLYTIGADHPRVRQDPAQDQFILLGMSALPWNLRPRLAPNVPTNGTIELRNLSPLPLSGVSVTAENLPLDFTFAGSITNTLGGDQTEILSYQIATTLATASQGSFNILVQTTEGARLRIPVNFTVAPPTAQLVASPASLEHGMLRGAQTLVSFDVINQGGVPSGDLAVALPVAPWLSLISTSPIPSLPPGGRSTVVLALTPPADLPLTLYNGTLAVIGDQTSLGVPFQFRALSEARGDLLLTFTDENTYYAEGAPKITNATVTLRDPIGNAVVTNATSDTNGGVRFTDLPEGDYLLEASAPVHAGVRGGLRVAPGITTEQEVFMTRHSVRYEWSVVPTEIEDHYRVVLQPQFETEVPHPQLVVENPIIAPLVIVGQTSQFDIRLRNSGLVALERVRVPVPNHPRLEITPLVTELEVLPAQTSVTIPVTIRVKTDGGGAGGFQAAAPPPPCAGTECVVHLPIDTGFRCGTMFVTQTVPVELQVVCVPDTGCQFDRVDVTRIDFMTANSVAARAEFDCLLGNMDECQKARVRGYLRSGDFGTVDGPFGFGISDFCGCAPPERIPALLSFACQYMESFPPEFQAVGGCPGATTPAPVGTTVNLGTFTFSSFLIPGPCNAPFAPAGAGAAPVRAAAAGGEPEGVCAKVRMELSQDVTMTRTAFRGTLVIENDGADLTGLQVSLDFRNAANQSVASLFAIRGPTLSGVTAIDGSGVIAGGSSGSVEYLFIPTLDAAPLGPTAYYIGGTLRFIEDGRVVTVPLLAAPITVFPEARLTLDYFQQRDVFSDDPFTPELEPAEPFALGLRIRNNGAGAARNFRIQSGQPRIIESNKGLVIDFRLLGLRIGDEPRTPTFDLALADIQPGGSKVAIWDMVSSLQGKFIDFRASFEHVDALGSQNLSLIESVILHELIHVVLDYRLGADTLPDFLVNDSPDPNNAPDVVYLSTGSNAPVSLGSNAVIDSAPATNDLQVQLMATMPSGWTYLRMTNPGPDFRLVSVRRSDGKQIRIPENAWTTDRTFPSSIPGALREKTLHLFDHDSTGIYTLTFGPIAQDTNAPTSAVTALAAASPSSFAVEWSGDDGAGGSGIAFFDIFVSVNGGPYTNWLARTTQRSALFDGVNGETYAFYSRATDVAGNEEIAPASADAQTSASSVNTPPSLVPIADATIDEGALFSVLPNAIDTDLPRQTLSFSLLQSPPGATIDGAGGFIRWQTGEAQGGASYPFTLVVADNGLPSLSATQSFTVFVREANAPPFFVDPASDIQIDEETLLSQIIAATDGDLPAQPLAWTLAPGAPVGMSIGAATGLLQWLPGESRGPGEYPITVTVRDNGVPQQSVSRLLRVIVREVNRPPDLAPIPTQAALVQTSLSFTNSATDPDVPAQEFFFSLAPGAPQGARIGRTNGVFTWTPAASFARSTNFVTVRVTDNGVPSLTSSRTFAIVVGDVLEARLGTGIVIAGQTGSVPVIVFTSVPATNATFTFEVPDTRLGTFSLDAPVPPLGSAVLQSLGGNRYRVRLGAAAGQQFAGEQSLSRLRFVAASGQSSAFVRLPVSDVSGVQTDGQPVPRALGSPGRVVYLGPEPLLEALRTTGGQVELHLYARPAPGYTVETTLSLNPIVQWLPFWNGPVNNLLEVLTLSPTNQMQFFRARTP